MKTCTKCDTPKPIDQFRENPRYADGRVNWCNDCSAAYRREHYQKNREKVRAQNAEWFAANRDRRLAKSREWYAENAERHAANVSAAKAKNPDQYREKAKLNARVRRESRIELRLRSRLSSQFRYCLPAGKGGKATELLVGYSLQELRTHLERQFLPNMSWANMGEWHIDHIVPLNSFKITGADDPEIRRAWALTNLRPLWAADNLKKSGKITFLI